MQMGTGCPIISNPQSTAVEQCLLFNVKLHPQFRSDQLWNKIWVFFGILLGNCVGTCMHVVFNRMNITCSCPNIYIKVGYPFNTL